MVENKRDGVLRVQKQIADQVKSAADLVYGLLCAATEPDHIEYFLSKYGYLAAKAFDMLEMIRCSEAEAEQLRIDASW